MQYVGSILNTCTLKLSTSKHSILLNLKSFKSSRFVPKIFIKMLKSQFDCVNRSPFDSTDVDLSETLGPFVNGTLM